MVYLDSPLCYNILFFSLNGPSDNSAVQPCKNGRLHQRRASVRVAEFGKATFCKPRILVADHVRKTFRTALESEQHVSDHLNWM